jgi:hypothetical protein
MKRWAWHIACGLSFVLCIALGWMWLRSFSVIESIEIRRLPVQSCLWLGESCTIYSATGRIGYAIDLISSDRPRHFVLFRMEREVDPES